jgi:hypothetical protein
MIVYDLACDKGHQFEAWFKDSATYERQEKKKQLSCAVCGSSRVRKAPMAPRIGSGKSKESEDAPKSLANDPEVKQATAIMKERIALRRHVEKNADSGGQKFADEARNMHYGEKSRRNIFGEASNKEAEELSEEGIEFARIPWMPRHDS